VIGDSVKGGRILVVDDEPMVRQSVGQFLEDEGYVVDQASDGADALAIIAERRPDAVLLDIMMPGMNGRQLLRALRADPRYVDLPVVVMTAVRGLTVQPGTLGTNDVVEKPFDINELLNKLALVIYRSRLERKNPSVPPAIATATEPAAHPAVEKGVVLVVDHNRTSLQRLDALLSTRGYIVVSLTRITPQLPRLARALQPRAILLDVADAEEDAIVATMRGDRALDDIPIVVFARTDAETAVASPSAAAPPADEELLRFLDRVS
jgi:CheY-like chemotaxis protein